MLWIQMILMTLCFHRHDSGRAGGGNVFSGVGDICDFSALGMSSQKFMCWGLNHEKKNRWDLELGPLEVSRIRRFGESVARWYHCSLKRDGRDLQGIRMHTCNLGS